MTEGELYPVDRGAFVQIHESVKRVLETDRRLPDWPFRVPFGNADICQFSSAIEGPFSTVLQALVDTYADETVSLVVLDPSPDYYREHYGSYPAFVTPGAAIANTYWDTVAHEPDGDPSGAVTYTANVVALAGSSGAWGVWAERSWDLAIVLSQRTNGPWTSCGVNFVAPAEALASFTEPDFKLPLAASVKDVFLQNVRVRGRT